ncbi:MAG: hypothetical protein NTX28_08240 [Novosphingobium sp.]|nr:hypothetical protein [Novosphingobium sp.]
MKINRAPRLAPVFSCALALLASACSAPQVVPPPAPQPTSRPAPPPPPPAPAPAVKDWRDAPQTAGDWRYGNGTAQFGPAGSALFALTCNRAARTVSLIRAGSATQALPMTVATTSETRPLSASPAAPGTPQLIVALPANDRLLDAMAFSRGRFAVEVNGLPTLYLPAWPEVARVIEDCRR